MDDFHPGWHRTDDAPEKHEFADDHHPLNDAMTVNPFGYVVRERARRWRWRTYTNPHHYGIASSLKSAKAHVERIWEEHRRGQG